MNKICNEVYMSQMKYMGITTYFLATLILFLKTFTDIDI